MYRLLIGIVLFALTSAQYSESIRQWQAQRDKALRSPDGWLALVGLLWLNEGDIDLILPPGSAAAAKLGRLHLSKDKVVFGRWTGRAVFSALTKRSQTWFTQAQSVFTSLSAERDSRYGRKTPTVLC